MAGPLGRGRRSGAGSVWVRGNFAVIAEQGKAHEDDAQ